MYGEKECITIKLNELNHTKRQKVVQIQQSKNRKL